MLTNNNYEYKLLHVLSGYPCPAVDRTMHRSNLALRFSIPYVPNAFAYFMSINVCTQHPELPGTDAGMQGLTTNVIV